MDKNSLINDLERAGIDRKGTLLVHISLKSVGNVEGGGETVIDALMEYMEEGLLVIPCHTWNSVNKENPVFDVKKSQSCIGIVPELFRKRERVFRSLHPTHSVCAYGAGAEEFIAGQEKFDTPCAPESCYGKLEKRDAQVLLIGIDFSRNTSIHCIEELAGVPNRLTNECEPLVVIDWEGHKIPCPSHRHHNANSDLYVKLEPVMYKRNLLEKVKFGEADALSFRQKDLFKTALEMLEKDIHLFDDDKPVPKDFY